MVNEQYLLTVKNCNSDNANNAFLALKAGLFISIQYDLYRKLLSVIRGNLISGNDIGMEVIIKKDEKNNPIGVALYNPYDISGYPNIQVFVKPEHRRKGIGRLLVEEIKQKFPQEQYNVALGDDNSGKFWCRIGMALSIFNERNLNEKPKKKMKV